jgi:hypothetical protein
LIVLDIIARGINLAVQRMKRIILRYASPLLGLLITLLGFGVRIADAQQTMEVPQPMPQGQPSIHYRPKPTPSIVTPPPQVPDQSNQSDVIPSMPTPPAAEPMPEAETQSPSYRMVQPVLPAIFRGCWEGKVEFLDSIERLPGAAKVGIWTPKTYRLCYQRYGDGPFQLTFSEAGIDSNSKIINPLNSLDLISTDGRTYATMRALLHFDEYHTADYSPGSTFAVDETARLQCDIQPDGMHVIGSVHGTRDGDPWFRAYWHTLFVHVPG